MNDQWSGNTLLSAVRAKRAAPRRSSNQRARRRDQHQRVAVPEAGTDGLGRSRPAARSMAVVVDHERELRERARRRAEHRAGAVEHLERRLVARAQQPLELLLVEADGTAGVRAHLRVRDVPLRRPGLATRAGSRVFSRHADQHRLRVGSTPTCPSGNTVMTPPTSRSSTFTGSPCSSTTREPLRHFVTNSELPGTRAERRDREQRGEADGAGRRRRTS